MKWKDKCGVEHVQNYSHFLTVAEPGPKSMALASAVARVTGDLHALSNTDLRVVALTVKFAKEAGLEVRDGEAVKDLLAKKRFTQFQKTKAGASNTTTQSRISKEQPAPVTATRALSEATESGETTSRKAVDSSPLEQIVEGAPVNEHRDEDISCDGNAPESLRNVESDTADSDSHDATLDSEEELEKPVDENEDFKVLQVDNSGPVQSTKWMMTVEELEQLKSTLGDGWVTAENFHTRAAASFTDAERTEELDEENKVVCITGDFAMQNVLMALGIPVSTPTGRRIRHIRQWSWMCTACKKMAEDAGNPFCSGCGYASLQRVSVMTNRDGSQSVMLGPRKGGPKEVNYKVRPLQGKHQDKSILRSADMLLMGGRDRELRKKEKQEYREKAAAFGEWLTADDVGPAPVRGGRSNVRKFFTVESSRRRARK